MTKPVTVLTIKTTPEYAARLQKMHADGKLRQIAGIDVLSVGPHEHDDSGPNGGCSQGCDFDEDGDE